METIVRKTLLYRSALGFYGVNHVQGCAHGCRYPCYAYKLASQHGRVRDYAEWCRPKLVANALELLENELGRLKRKPESVHLCLSTDPFMTGYPEVGEMSLKIIARINAHGIPCSVLTKGILPPDLADRVRFRSDNTYRISLISLDEDFRRKWEPQTAPYRDRIQALKYLHDRGCHTEVHMEPYPTPNMLKQDLAAILETVAFVDAVYFSGWNYNPEAGQYPGRKAFYAGQIRIVEEFCARRRIRCDAHG